MLFIVVCLFVLLTIVRVQWLLNYAVMQFSFVVVVVLVIVLSTRITSNTNKKKTNMTKNAPTAQLNKLYG